MPFLCLFISLLLIVADQVSKYFVSVYLKPVGTITVVKNFLSLSYLENTGISFGLLPNKRWLFVILTILIVIALLVMLFKYKKHDFLSYAILTLLIAGGVGNLIDRIRLAYVIDFIKVEFFGYIFNLADCFVVVGAFLFVIYIIMMEVKSKRSLENKVNDE